MLVKCKECEGYGYLHLYENQEDKQFTECDSCFSAGWYYTDQNNSGSTAMGLYDIGYYVDEYSM